MENLTLQQLNEHFKVKVKHKIYTFNTKSNPDYLKIGDTYRQVAIRLNEWKRVYKNLRPNQIYSAEINNEVFFRDTAVHKFLREDMNKHIVTQQEVEGVTPYCTELFRADNISENDVNSAIEDIKEQYRVKSNKYAYYKIDGGSRVSRVIERNQEYPLRPLQEDAVKCFMRAIEEGRTNLLMYAVMRFGKSFTAMQCAKRYADSGKSLNFIVITAAKKVESEWERTIKSHKDFEKFVFLTDSDLAEDYEKIPQLISQGNKVVLFLTLQTLNKKVVAERHKQVFETPIDMLFIDETHYGARGDQLGAIISTEEIEIANVVKNRLHATINLHLSGTPYRILQNGEFEDEDIIAFVQFADIEKAKENWCIEHHDEIEDPENDLEVWDNPYFGFPQMIRFAFNISEVSQKVLGELEQEGLGYFEQMFETLSDNKDTEDYRKFVNEADVLKLFKTIDGSDEGNQLLSFLQFEGVKAADICRHIVCVLPRRTSCDALAKLLSDHKAEFKNLNDDYKIINISGLDTPFTGDYAEKVRKKIADYEKQGKKTISLTVGKMLTGATVEYWDSMFYLKDTMSSQEYDQATFRIQSPYIESSPQINDRNKSIKIDKKPQTLLVDFHPKRMLYMQASRIDKLLTVNKSDDEINLATAAQESLTISPIICLNKDKLQKIDEQTIVDKIIHYSKNKSVIEETIDMSVSQAFLTNESIRGMLGHHPELDVKTGIKHDPNENAPETDLEGIDSVEGNGNTKKQTSKSTSTAKEDSNEDNINRLRKKLSACVAKMLFYVFISGEKCANLDDVIKSINKNIRNKRIADNFNVTVEDLTLINNIAKGNDMRSIVKSITTLSKLSEENFTNIEKAKIAIKKFNRFSSSEVVTPSHICKQMLECIGEERLIEIINSGGKLLDIASKAGEFAVELYVMLRDKVENDKLCKAIYSIPTSSEAYEFTRYAYEQIGLDPLYIADVKFTTYGLLDIKDSQGKVDYDKISKLITQKKSFRDIKIDDSITEGEERVKFDVIVGNPPYQVMDGGNGVSASPIYNQFVSLAKKLAPKCLSMIIPSRWFVGGKGLDEFRGEMINDDHISLMVDFPNTYDAFPSVDIAGGVCYFLWDGKSSGKCTIKSLVNGQTIASQRRMNEFDVFVRDSLAVDIIRKVNSKSNQSLEEVVLPRKPFGLPTNYQPHEQGVPCWFIQKIGKKFALAEDIEDRFKCLDKWKFLVPKAPIAGQTDFSKPVGFYYEGNTKIAAPGECCTESFVVAGAFDSKEEALSYRSYIFTKTVRFLLLQAVVSQDVTRKNFCFIPDLGEYKGTYTDAKLCEKWGITEKEWKYIDSRISNYKK